MPFIKHSVLLLNKTFKHDISFEYEFVYILSILFSFTHSGFSFNVSNELISKSSNIETLVFDIGI